MLLFTGSLAQPPSANARAAPRTRARASMHACLSEGAAGLQGDLLNDLQRHYRMNFPDVRKSNRSVSFVGLHRIGL
jgi:hypothetical protein